MVNSQVFKVASRRKVRDGLCCNTLARTEQPVKPGSSDFNCVLFILISCLEGFEMAHLCRSEEATYVCLVYPQMMLARIDVEQQMTLERYTPMKQILKWLGVRFKIALFLLTSIYLSVA